MYKTIQSRIFKPQYAYVIYGFWNNNASYYSPFTNCSPEYILKMNNAFMISHLLVILITPVK